MKRTLMIAVAVLAAVAGAHSTKAADVKMAIPGNNPLNSGLLGQAQPSPPQGGGKWGQAHPTLAPTKGGLGGTLPGMVPTDNMTSK